MDALYCHEHIYTFKDAYLKILKTSTLSVVSDLFRGRLKEFL